MTAVWPAAVAARALAGTFQEEPEIDVAKSAPEMGAIVLRRRSTILSDDVKFTVNMTKTEYEVFDNFYSNTLKDGVLPFEFTDPRTQQTVTYQFTAGPRAKGAGPYHYDVSFSLRRLP